MQASGRGSVGGGPVAGLRAKEEVPFNLRLVTRSIVKASDKKVPANFLRPGRARILTHACPVIPHLRHRSTKGNSKPLQEPSAGAASTSGGFDGREGKGGEGMSSKRHDTVQETQSSWIPECNTVLFLSLAWRCPMRGCRACDAPIRCWP
jgi:hypothetical protein